VQKAPPPLPPWLADPTPTVLVGTGVWLVATVTLLGAHLVADRPLDDWFWGSVSGLALGVLGYSLFRWQRSAVRRGSRSPQQGLT